MLQQLGIGSFGGEDGNEDQNAYQAMMQVTQQQTWASLHNGFKAAAWYWHYVDIVWLVDFVQSHRGGWQ